MSQAPQAQTSKPVPKTMAEWAAGNSIEDPDLAKVDSNTGQVVQEVADTSEPAEIVGGPFDEHNLPSEEPESQTTEPQPAEAAPETAEEPVQQKPETAKPVYEGLSKTFQTQEELISYTRELEKNALLSEAQQVAKQAAEVPETVDERPKIDIDSFIEDPDAVLGQVESNALQKFEAILEKKELEKTRETQFYAENRDLEPFPKLVHFISNRDRKELEELPDDARLKELANRSRSFLNEVKQTSGSEVVSSRTLTAGATVAQPPRSQPEVEAEPKSMMDQISDMQRKKAAST